MHAYNPNYFLDTSSHILENEKLREPQKQAYFKIYEHFVSSGKTSQAIIVLPTGVGKTGVMGIAPFNICRGRVLIITPQLTVKDTVLGSLNPYNHDNFWSARDVLSLKDLPAIIEYESNKTPLEVLNLANIVILNIHKLQERLESSLLKRVTKDFFDMIIIDEAHHSPANTWVEALQYFSQAKIIKLTGTPIRSDGIKLSGELIYEYKLSQAMAKNYVKSLVKSEYIPDEVRFTLDGDEDKTYSLEEIEKIKDEDWISRSVAYSKQCSLQIVHESIKILNEKKNLSNQPHKIIAVACSIKHAEQIKQLYADKGIRSIVIHSGMEQLEIDALKNDIDRDRVDVIVNVGMLGEGYDHRYLSVAAIFRPFRNELPYAQFIGRILRYIPESTNPGDNIGQVVSHKYLYLDKLWQKYKIEIAESEIIRNLQDNNYLQEVEDLNPVEYQNVHALDIGKVSSSNGVIIEDAYIQTAILKKHREKSDELNFKAQQLATLLGISKDDAKKIIESQKTDSKLTRPDLVYKRSREDIDIRIKEEIVPELMVKYVAENQEKSLKNCRLFQPVEFKWITAKYPTPDASLVIYFNCYLKKMLGKQRSEWTIVDFQKANEILDNQAEYVAKILEDFYQ